MYLHIHQMKITIPECQSSLPGIKKDYFRILTWLKPLGMMTVWLLLAVLNTDGQTKEFDLYRLAQSGGLKVENRTLSVLIADQKKGVRFLANEGDGVAWLDGVDFSNGIIEVDIRGKDVLQQSFVGIAFHAKSRDSLEVVYFRPFNFRSTDSTRKSHAVQYAFHPDFPWERLRKEHSGQYEKAVDPAPVADQWFHAKIVIHHPSITVYVNGNGLPCLTVQALSTRQDGKIGLWVGNNSDGDFANLSIRNQ
jgi:hypothetical protein